MGTLIADNIKTATVKQTNGTSAITIDSSGRTTFNNSARIQFQLGFSNDDMSNVGTADGTDYRITYTQALINSNGAGGTCVADAGSGTFHTFTAPITGLYLFYTSHYTNYTSNNARTKAVVYVDGSNTHNQTLVSWTANWDTETSAGLTYPIYLTATQTVDSRMALYDSNGTSNTFQIYRHRQLSFFGGVLIG